ncbi:MAG TPA: GGDEF domain-containing protein [Burkholderiaceae bacterium]
MFNKKAFFNMWHRIDSGRFLFNWINRLTIGRTFFLSTLMLVIVAIADYFSHVELTLSPWYTFPCFLVDWRIGRMSALAYAVFATILQLLIGLTGTHDYPNHYYLAVDLVLNLAFCIVLIWIIAKLRLALEMEIILSRSDFLTKLANRDSLLEGLENEIKRCSRQENTLTVAMIDLDNFNRFNEKRGYSVGDLLLAAIAEELGNRFRSTDIIARTGGDEFTMILPTRSSDIIESKLHLLRKDLENLLMVRGWDITFGMAAIVFVEPTVSGEQAMFEIQQLMQELKQRGTHEFAHRIFSINGSASNVEQTQVRQAC